MLDDIYFGPGLECAPGSIQPVIYMKDGERQIGEMRWGFKLPDRLLFNARSDTVTTALFWRERLHHRCIVPAASFFEWKKTAPELTCTGKLRQNSLEISACVIRFVPD
jgi:putative SOS response-associated peptidase YedK